MTPRQKKQRLDALGIDTWVRRDAPAAATAAADAPAASAAVPAAKPATPPEPAAPVPPSASTAPTLAASGFAVPDDWNALREVVRGCQRCKLCKTRTQTVFGVGVATAPLMIVGEGPGADEDAQGEPFVGRAGKLLDEMLHSIGRSRADNTYIANVVKCRPPGNRDPEPDEIESCRPYLDMQIQLLQPKLIVALGRIAAQRLLSSDQPLSRLRGPLHQYGKFQTPVFVTYHPAYLLRSPKEKAKSWEDLKKVWQYLAR